MAQDDLNLQTDVNLTPPLKKMRLGGQAAPSLQQVQGYILEESRQELRFPKSIQLYKQMLLDPNVASAVSLIELMISRVSWKIDTPKDAPAAEKIRCEQLNYNLVTMARPFQEYIIEFLSYIPFGYATPEKVYEKFKNTPVGDFVGWKDFRMISQDTVGQWFFSDTTGELKGLRQDLSNINRSGRVFIGGSQGSASTNKRKDIPRKKFLLFRHNPKRDNPEGISPLKSCYTSWKYRAIIEEYETIGVTKDLGGVPVIGVDVSYLATAAANPSSSEALVIEEMKLQAANLHAGDQTYAIKPIAYTEKGKELFTFELKGIEGGGKQYDTDTIIKRHDSKILMTFFADVLKMGNDQHGSFSLADTKTTLLSMGVEAHLENIKRTLNHDLIKQTYGLNDWEYDPRTACRFVHGDIEQRDIAELSAALQRVAATGLLRPTDDIEDKLRKDWLDLPPTKEVNPEFLPTKESGSGKGMDEGLNDGTGSSTSKGSDRSKSNKENK